MSRITIPPWAVHACGLVIVGCLIAPAFDAIGSKGTSCRDDFAAADLLALRSCVEMFSISHGRPPTQEEGLQALVRRPIAWPEDKPWKQSAAEPIQDRWKRPFHYTIASTKTGFHLTLRSYGPDGVPSGDDRLLEWDTPERSNR